MNIKNVQDLIQTHRANKRFDPTTTLYSAMPSVKDVSVSEMGLTAKTGPFRSSSLQNKRNSGMHSTFFVPSNREDFGPKEKPQLSTLKRRLKAKDALDEEITRNQFDVSMILYEKPFASPKNLISV